MSDKQRYRVLFYAGTSLINTMPDRCEGDARADIAEWVDAEVGRNCRVEPALPTLEAPEVEGSVMPILPAKFYLVTYETDMGEFNIVTDDPVQSDVFMSEFIRGLGLHSDGVEHVTSVTDGPPVHVVIIEGLTHVKSLHPSDVVKPVKETDPDDVTHDVDIEPGLTD